MITIDGVELIRGIERILCVVFGGVSLLCGYKLFLHGFVKPAGDLHVETKGKKLGLTKAAPGIFFALFGAFVICFSLSNKLDLKDNQTNITQNSGPAPQTIPVLMITEANKKSDCVAPPAGSNAPVSKPPDTVKNNQTAPLPKVSQLSLPLIEAPIEKAVTAVKSDSAPQTQGSTEKEEQPGPTTRFYIPSQRGRDVHYYFGPQHFPIQEFRIQTHERSTSYIVPMPPPCSMGRRLYTPIMLREPSDIGPGHPFARCWAP